MTGQGNRGQNTTTLFFLLIEAKMISLLLGNDMTLIHIPKNEVISILFSGKNVLMTTPKFYCSRNEFLPSTPWSQADFVFEKPTMKVVVTPRPRIFEITCYSYSIILQNSIYSILVVKITRSRGPEGQNLSWVGFKSVIVSKHQ